MNTVTMLDGQDTSLDFAAMLEESFEMEQPERGDILTGTVLAIETRHDQ
jgi:ribosomal protein S1